MKIAYFLVGRVNPNGTNGGDRVIYHLARATAELGGEILIAGLSEKPPLPVSGVAVRYFAPPQNPFSLPAGLVDDLLAFKPDLVHFHDLYHPGSSILARWLRRRGIPYAISVYGALMPGALSQRRVTKSMYIRFLARSYLRRASLVHAMSNAEAEAIARFAVGVPAVVAPHGIEGVDPVSLDGGYLRRRYPELAGKRILGFLGRLDPVNKGLDLVVEASARLRLQNTTIVLAGPNWRGRTDSLRDRVRSLNLSDRILFAGPIPTGPVAVKEKFDFLASCDAFLHPSRWEAGIPFSVLDALEVGKPCMVTDAAFFGDFFRRNRAGLQVPATIDGVAKGLHRLAASSDEDLRRTGIQGRSAVLREFSWKRTAAGILAGYQRVAIGAGPDREAAR